MERFLKLNLLFFKFIKLKYNILLEKILMYHYVI